jgi:hypothetical protein
LQYIAKGKRNTGLPNCDSESKETERVSKPTVVAAVVVAAAAAVAVK